MALNLDGKKVLVSEVSAVAATAQSVVAAEYRGLTVAQMSDLRSKARVAGVYVRVVKNTLARKALAGTQFECIGPTLKGPLVLAFSKDDPGAAARVIKAFAKDHDKLKPTGIALGGQLLPGKDLDKVANLPTRDQALSMLMGVIRHRFKSSWVLWPRLRPSWFVPSQPSATRSKLRPDPVRKARSDSRLNE